jgi:hypothetical protein
MMTLDIVREHRNSYHNSIGAPGEIRGALSDSAAFLGCPLSTGCSGSPEVTMRESWNGTRIEGWGGN